MVETEHCFANCTVFVSLAHIHRCNYTVVVWIGQPDVNERLMSREAPVSTILVQWYERATHHGVGVRAWDTSRGRHM